MTLDLPGVRPPVLSRESARKLNEFLRFRHRYRNMYAYDLEWKPVRKLVEAVPTVWTHVERDLEEFLEFLDAAAEAGS